MKSVRLPLWNRTRSNVSGVDPLFESFNNLTPLAVPVRWKPKLMVRVETFSEAACGCAGSAPARPGASAAPPITAMTINAAMPTRRVREPLVV